MVPLQNPPTLHPVIHPAPFRLHRPAQPTLCAAHLDAELPGLPNVGILPQPSGWLQRLPTTFTIPGSLCAAQWAGRPPRAPKVGYLSQPYTRVREESRTGGSVRRSRATTPSGSLKVGLVKYLSHSPVHVGRGRLLGEWEATPLSLIKEEGQV